jgi:hypothetical protein
MTAGASALSPVHIVVTCTNRKQVSIPEHLCLGSLRDRRPEQRFAEWTRRLTAEESAISARDLYGGEHWRIATSLPSLVGRSARLWVCSAGYGLVSLDCAESLRGDVLDRHQRLRWQCFERVAALVAAIG